MADEETITVETKGYILLIEWDGGKPPTRWYTILADDGLTVRGTNNRDLSPLERRINNYTGPSFPHKHSGQSGVIFQEGVIIANSLTMLQRLGRYAKEMGAKTVMVGTASVDQLRMSEADEKVFCSITALTSKRGPKTKIEEGNYVVTCFEENQTYVVASRERPIECPVCRGTRIHWRKGEQKHVKKFNTQTDDMLDYWLRTRFDENGQFEHPKADGTTTPTTPDIKAYNQETQNKITQVAVFTRSFAETIGGDGKKILVSMDVAYSLQSIPDEVRLNRRIEALREFYQSGKNTLYPMAVNPLEVDMVDIAGSDGVFGMYL